jgi:hypothetical protein
MRIKINFFLIPLTGLGILIIFLGMLTTWPAQAAPTTRYVAQQSACGGRSPCYADVQAAVDDSTPGDEILVAGGIYTGVQPVMVNGSVYTQALFIDKDITIRGGFTTTNWTHPDPDAFPTILDAQYAGRVIYISNGINVTLENIEITQGDDHFQGGGVNVFAANVIISDCQITSNSSQNGGGIHNSGVVTLINSTISDNFGSSSDRKDVGGGIKNIGSMNLFNSTITSNTAYIGAGIHNAGTMKIIASMLSHNQGEEFGASNGGGMINNEIGILELVDSTVYGNSSLLAGGILNRGLMTITNSTVSQNWSPSGGIAGIANVNGELKITNATIVSNTGSAPGIGGGIHNEDIFNLDVQPVLSITNSIVAHNTGSNCDGELTSLGHNIEDNISCGFTSNGDLSSTNPMLDALGFYSGPTLVYGLKIESPAVDAGDDAACPATDQRGLSRVQGMRCDIGAFELELETFRLYLPVMPNQSQ